MFQELKPDQFERVRPLFQDFDYSLSIQAAIEGNSPGRIFVDDIHKPRTALALTVEGYLLAGDGDDLETIGGLSRLLKEKEFSGDVYVKGDQAIKYIQEAARAGWSNVEWTKTQEEFEFLRGMSAWDAVLAKMEEIASEE